MAGSSSEAAGASSDAADPSSEAAGVLPSSEAAGCSNETTGASSAGRDAERIARGGSLAAAPAIEPGRARRLAAAVAELLGELAATRGALWQREAELAACVPVVPRGEGDRQLAARLEATLRAGAEAVGADAAALYLLDESTSHLKLRSAWGLPFDRFTAPARPLRGAVADLEALLGHAVVLNDPELICRWNPPEDFPASVCLPVSTATTLLGTLWVFSGVRRDFDARETNLLEVVSGRLAAELERQVLLAEAVRTARLRREIEAAERLQRSQLPTIAPMLDGWQVAGWTLQAGPLGGDFHDWFCLGGGLLALAVGDAMHRGVDAALAAASVRSALRAHAQYHRDAARVLQQTNLGFWTASAGDLFASAALALVDTESGDVSYAASGDVSVLHLHGEGWASIGQGGPPLGRSPEPELASRNLRLQRGESLVLLSDGLRQTHRRERRTVEATIAERMQRQLRLSATELAGRARRWFETAVPEPRGDDATVVVLKRTGG